MEKAQTANVLRIGDYVTFKNVKADCFLSAEGILLEDLIVVEKVTVFDDCLFCIHLQRQYSAARELEEFIASQEEAIAKGQPVDNSQSKYLQALQRGANNENKLNDIYLKKKTGEVVLFGDIIQLFHVKSGKYVTSIPGTLAKVERENIRMYLDTNGNAFSYMKICPRFKIDREGDRVLSNSELYLAVAERTNEYVHRADRDPFPGCDREVNCSLEPTAWHMSIFQSSVDAVDPKILLASQLVSINDPETRCNVTIAMKPIESLDESKPEEKQAASGKVTTIDVSVLDGDDFYEDGREFFHEFGDIILEPYSEIVSSNTLWFIELESLSVGGPIKLKTDKVRFKHMNTGLYLRQDFTEKFLADGTFSESAIFTTSPDPDVPGTLFSVVELISTGKFLSNAKALQIGCGGIWIERGEVLESGAQVVKGTTDKLTALSLLLTRYEPKRLSGPLETEGEEAVSKEPLDVYVGLSARKYFSKYYEMTEIPTSDSISTLWTTSTREDLKFFDLVIEKSVYFSQGFPISSKKVELGIDKADALLCRQRQNLLREQGSLEIMLRMINKLVPITAKMDAAKNIPAKRRPVLTDAQHAVNSMGQLLLSKCFELLYYSILNNEDNQMYVADFMPVLLAHLSSQPLAGMCVTEMLSKNLALQETKIGTREIQIFVDKLRSSKMNAMYLRLLQSCCSCEGEGVDGNQCKVATMLFSDTNDIIINLHAEYSRPVPAVWDPQSFYAPLVPVPGSPVRGDHLMTKGLPTLSLAWTTNSIDFSPLGLFGKLSVNVEELFKRVITIDTKVEKSSSGIENKAKSKKKASEEQKQAVANYFIAEMFLGAEMCMDRNYIAMHKLDDLFPYEVLITIIKMDVSNALKSAAVRLLMCLHVDRDPQASSKIPRLTRTWSEVQQHEKPQLPFVDAGRRNVFGLIQQMVSEHIRSMAGQKWAELSRHMLKMLRTLVDFNFYGNEERMKDVIEPLLAALDRRKLSSDDNTIQAIEASKADVTSSPADDGGGAGAAVGEGGAAAASAAGGGGAATPGGGEGNQLEEGGDFGEVVKANDDADGGEGQDGGGAGGFLTSVKEFASGLFKGKIDLTLGDDDASNGKSGKFEFKMPIRYSKAPTFELETMVEAVDILAFAQRVIEDRNLSILLRYFYSWDKGSEKRSPSEIFRHICENDCKELTLGSAAFDDILLDVLMFVHTPLTQSALEVLMAHHSMKRTLLDNARGMQLLVSHQRERQYKIVDQMLQQLEQNAETHELWGELETEADQAVNKQTKDILKELIDICRIRRQVLEFDEEFMADVEIQNLYRNLGCFDICMKVLGLLDTSDAEGDGDEEEGAEEDPVEENTRELCLLCNNLLYWFFLGNTKNQVLGFAELEFFLDTLDANIKSHQVIKAIFKNNEALMREVPHSHLNDLVDRIIKKGRSPHYLMLFAVISHAGERNVLSNQFEIVKLLTSPGRLEKIGCFFVPVDHPEYEVKRKLMAPYLNSRDLALDDMPPLLAYHLLFLEVLSGCTVGKDITTAEAKVQSVFSYNDQIQSILDPGTIVSTKTRLSRFFYNSIIEVELKIPGLESSPLMWTLLDSYKAVLKTAKDDMIAVDKLGWESHQVSRQKIEYVIVCIQIIGGFFDVYYNNNVFKGGDDRKTPKHGGGAPVPGKGIHFSLTHVDELILFFFTAIKEIHDLESKRLSYETRVEIYTALVALNKSMSSAGEITSYIKPVSQNVGKAKLETNDDSMDIETAEDAEKMMIARFDEFMKGLEEDESIQYEANNENVAFIKVLEALPYIWEPKDADVRYDSLIKKLVFHIRENIKIVNNTKRLDARVTKTSTWIIRAFRTMIENKMGMSIYERDDEGGAEQDEAAAPVVNALNTCGATALCLDLIAVGIDEELQLEAIKLGVGLLFKEGGALEVQGLMNAHLSSTSSDLFFAQVRLTINKLKAWHEWQADKKTDPHEQQQKEDEGGDDGEEEPEIPPSALIIRFLQLMCEGHYLPNQDIMREQPHNHTSVNLLDDYVGYLLCLSRIPCRTSTVAAIRLTATILEVIQGPCEGNQVHFALNTELIETLNRINRSKLIKGCKLDEEIELKKTSIDIFQGLLEGQGERSVVYERVLSVVHLDIILLMSKKQTLEPERDEKELALTKGKKAAKVAPPSEEQIILQTECVVLLQMLCNFKPSLYDELGISRNIKDIVGSGTAMIEIIWRGDIHRRFFHVPSICSYLAKSSKDALVEFVDRSNAENKLIDFLNRSHELYREVKHQQYLTEIGISRIFSRANQDRATWAAFILACLINLMMLLFYTAHTGDPTLSSEAEFVIQVMNTIQAIVAGFVLLLFLVVRIPVKAQSLAAAGYSSYNVWFYSALEPMTLYYMWYLAFTILGGVVSYDFLPFLLLDIIVKNSTTRDVLNAVIVPRKQIAMGGVVILFIVQIYAFFIFYYFRDDLQPQGEGFCRTFFGCYLVGLGYGLRNGGGVGDIFNTTVGRRWILDVSYYFVITIGMLNLIGGVIITTFGQLRENKARRVDDTENVCFICGIDKQVFDRASPEPDGFKTHILIDHNMWNYLYFIFMLWEQDKDDDDGLEQYVRRAIDANEIIWFPLNQAIRLDQAASVEESLINDLKKNIQTAETRVVNKLEKFQGDINLVLEQLNQTLKLDHQKQAHESQSRAKVPVTASNVDHEHALTAHAVSRSENLSTTARAQLSLFIDLLSISGLRLTVNDPLAKFDMLTCVITLDEIRQFVSCHYVDNFRRIVFDGEKKILIDNNLFSGDSRRVHFMMIFEMSSKREPQMSVDMLDIVVDDLALAEGAVMDCHFKVPGMEGQCKLAMVPSVEKSF